jgi:hypothetical protein
MQDPLVVCILVRMHRSMDLFRNNSRHFSFRSNKEMADRDIPTVVCHLMCNIFTGGILQKDVLLPSIRYYLCRSLHPGI